MLFDVINVWSAAHVVLSEILITNMFMKYAAIEALRTGGPSS